MVTNFSPAELNYWCELSNEIRPQICGVLDALKYKYILVPDKKIKLKCPVCGCHNSCVRAPEIDPDSTDGTWFCYAEYEFEKPRFPKFPCNKKYGGKAILSLIYAIRKNSSADAVKWAENFLGKPESIIEKTAAQLEEVKAALSLEERLKAELTIPPVKKPPKDEFSQLSGAALNARFRPAFKPSSYIVEE